MKDAEVYKVMARDDDGRLFSARAENEWRCEYKAGEPTTGYNDTPVMVFPDLRAAHVFAEEEVRSKEDAWVEIWMGDAVNARVPDRARLIRWQTETKAMQWAFWSLPIGDLVGLMRVTSWPTGTLFADSFTPRTRVWDYRAETPKKGEET
jgi:hypothetical protein